MHSRTKFYAWLKNNLFSFEEVYDLASLDESYECLVTDIDMIPSGYHGKIISYGAFSSIGTHIESFNDLASITAVKHIVVPDNILSDGKIYSIMDMAYQIQKKQSAADLVLGLAPLLEIDMGHQHVQAEQVIPESRVRHADIGGYVSQESPDMDEDLLTGVGRVSDIEPEREYTREETYESTDYSERFTEQPVHEYSQNQQYSPPNQQYYQAPTQVFSQSPYEQMYQGFAQQEQQFSQTSLAPIAPRNLAEVRTSSSGVHRVSRKQIKRSRSQSVGSDNVVFFFGVSPKSGVSILSYMMASYVAQVKPDKQVLLIDMDINQPDLSQFLCTGFQLSPNTDTIIKNLAIIPEFQLDEAIPALIQEVPFTDTNDMYTHINVMLNTGASFTDKRAMFAFDFRQRIQKLSEYYDYIFVDCGRLQASANYQLFLLSTLYQKVFVANGINQKYISEFIQTVGSMNLDYKVVLNRAAKNMTAASLTRNLGREVLAVIPNIVSLEPAIKRGQTALDIQNIAYQRNLEALREGLGL